MTRVVLATANPHKAVEMTAVLGAAGFDVVARPAGVADVDETADTLEGNALLKATALADATGEAAIADDTGLFVEALGGRPGVLQRALRRAPGTYYENVARLLGELADVAAPRRARFRTVIALVYPDGRAVSPRAPSRARSFRAARAPTDSATTRSSRPTRRRGAPWPSSSRARRIASRTGAARSAPSRESSPKGSCSRGVHL